MSSNIGFLRNDQSLVSVEFENYKKEIYGTLTNKESSFDDKMKTIADSIVNMAGFQINYAKKNNEDKETVNKNIIILKNENKSLKENIYVLESTIETEINKNKNVVKQLTKICAVLGNLESFRKEKFSTNLFLVKKILSFIEVDDKIVKTIHRNGLINKT